MSARPIFSGDTSEITCKAALSLREKLVAFTNNTDPKISDVTRHYINSAIYYALSDEGEYLEMMFPRADKSLFPKTWDDVELIHRHGLFPGSLFYADDTDAHWHLGRSCGSSFKDGEPIYRCIDCGFDETCVLCVHCFNEEDHKDHQVSVSIGTSSSGICDCGDSEAWVTELHCKANKELADKQQTSYNGPKKLDEHLSKVFLDVFKVLFDFIIEVMSHQEQVLPKVKDTMMKWVSNQDLGELQNCFQAEPLQPYTGVITPALNQYLLVVWNDEFHNFEQAIAAITGSSKLNRKQAFAAANKVNDEGRLILTKSSHLNQRLIDSYLKINKTGLTGTIMTLLTFIRQEIIKVILETFQNIQKNSNVEFQSFARTLFSEALCAEFDSKIYTPAFWTTYFQNKEYEDLLSSDCSLPPHAEVKSLNEPDLFNFMSTDLLTSSFKKEKATLSRLNYLCFLDLRFWKTSRKQLQKTLIAPLVANPTYKNLAASQIIREYGTNLYNLYHSDREPHLNIMNEISTQFFTCPKIATATLNSKSFLELLVPGVHILEETSSFTYDESNFHPPNSRNDPTRSHSEACHRFIFDITSLVDRASEINDPDSMRLIFYKFIQLMRLFDGNWKIQRIVGEHVQHENYNFIEYFNYSIIINNLIMSITSKDYENYKRLEENFLEPLILFLETRSIEVHNFKDVQIPKFEVSSEYVPFINPLNTLLARLIQNNIPSSSHLKKITPMEDTILKIADVSLRSIVLYSQVSAQFWIRNGVNVLKQGSIYQSNPSPANSFYYNDILMYQLSILACDPKAVLFNIIDRFELKSWYLNETSYDKTIYEERVFIMLSKLINLLYTLFSERSNLTRYETKEERAKTYFKKLFMYDLYHAPLKYSDISDQFDDAGKLFGVLDLTELINDALEEVSDYVPPKGLNDDGLYKLKTKYFKELDPLCFLAQETDFLDNVTSISKGLTNNSKTAIKSENIIPKLKALDNFKELGQFTRTTEFAKLVFKMFDVAIESGNDYYVPQLLHLVHGVILDAEFSADEITTELSAYVKIPICSALFTIINGEKFSKYSIKKAETVLNLLIKVFGQDIYETLEGSFTKELVEAFKTQMKIETDDLNEKKRQLAKERQKKIMAAMSKKQKVFMNKNDDNVDDVDKLEDDLNSENEESEIEVRQCVFCQLPEVEGELFCVPMSHKESGIFRQLEPHGAPSYFERSFKNWNEDSIVADSEYVGQGFPPLLRNPEPKFFFSSCNHGAHYKCCARKHEECKRSGREFICPLCKTPSNYFVPVVKQTKKFDFKSWDRTIPDTFAANHTRLLEAYCGNEFSAQFKADFAKVDKLKSGEDFTLMIKSLATTIAQHEISFRLSNGEPCDYLHLVSEQMSKKLKAILMGLLLSEEHFKHMNFNTLEFLPRFIMIYLFELGTQYGQIVTSCVFDLVLNYLTTLLHHYSNKNFDFRDFVNNFTPQVTNDLTFEDLVIKLSFEEDFDPRSLNLKEILKKLVLIDMRQLSIFMKVLDPTFRLKSYVNVDDELDNLLLSLQAPRFDEIIAECTTERCSSGRIVPLPYPGVIKLVDLPKDFLYFRVHQTNSEDKSRLRREGKVPSEYLIPFRVSGQVENSDTRIDFSICLTCGCKVFNNTMQAFGNQKSFELHRTECIDKHTQIFLLPNTNQVRLISFSTKMLASGMTPYRGIMLNAPYIDSHGQSGKKAVSGGNNPKLNLERYKNLNEMYLNGTIPSYIARNSASEGRIEPFGGEFIDIAAQFMQAVNAAATNVETMEADEDNDDEPGETIFINGDNGERIRTTVAGEFFRNLRNMRDQTPMDMSDEDFRTASENDDDDDDDDIDVDDDDVDVDDDEEEEFFEGMLNGDIDYDNDDGYDSSNSDNNLYTVLDVD